MKNFLVFCALIVFLIEISSSDIPPYRKSFSSSNKSNDTVKPLVEDGSLRLPNNTIPLYYDIHLTTHIHEGKFDFSGHVMINFYVKEAPLNLITLHMKFLEISKINLLDINKNSIENDVNFETDFGRQFLLIKPQNELILNQNYTLEFTYDGGLRNDNLGFYRSFYTTPQNEKVWVATTQFQSTEARSAFPCYDEPQIRTVFKIKITHGKNYTAISNMPEKTPIPAEIPNDYVTTEFEETLPVQTYLIAFIVSNFKSTSNSSTKPQHRVFGKPESIDAGEGKLALKYGVEIIQKFQDYLGVDYPLLKIDQFALSDFDAGAMENWGIVTYREEYLLSNSIVDGSKQKENVLTIISHEFAHMWFGDLVAPEWWSYLWLNEGFATLYEFYLVSLIYEEERLMDTFLLNSVRVALEMDSFDLRPMSYYAEFPWNIAALFDTIAYDKSGSVLRMFQNAIGDDTWRKGLMYYLKDKQFSFATPNDLHKGLQKSLNEDGMESLDIEKIMLSWETQGGYPFIHVSLKNGILTFTQEKFSLQPSNQTSDVLFYVPITYAVSNTSNPSVKPNFWMNKERSVSFTKETAPLIWNDEENDWIIVNLQQAYYYRVNYDENLWNLLIKQMNEDHTKIDYRNRGQLLDDAMNFARAGKIKYDVPFNFLKYLKKEEDYFPWDAIDGNILLLNRWLNGNPKYQKFILDLIDPLHKRMGFEVLENEHKFDRYLRSIAISLACQFGHKSCLDTTKLKANDENVHPDLQAVIYGMGLRGADKETYESAVERMLNTKGQAQRTLMINALGHSQNEELLMNYLKLTITDESRLRLQEKFRILNSWTNAGDVGTKNIMNFIKENHQKINGISQLQVRSMLGTVANRITSSDLTAQFNELLDKLMTDHVIDGDIKISNLATVNAIKAWQDKNAKDIEDWLDLNGTSTIIISTFVLTFSAIVKFFL